MPGDDAVDAAGGREVAGRCELDGGQVGEVTGHLLADVDHRSLAPDTGQRHRVARQRHGERGAEPLWVRVHAASREPLVAARRGQEGRDRHCAPRASGTPRSNIAELVATLKGVLHGAPRW